jgi:nitrile hydratase accessory protein
MTELLLDSLPSIPRDEGGPVFRAPWEAQAFAMVVNLHQKGLFPWSEWTERLASAIAESQQHGDPDLGDTYYQHWLNALERLLQDYGLATPDKLAERAAEIRHAHEHVDDHRH